MVTDEEYGNVLLRPLAGEPRTPSTVDVTRALAEGRRRRLRRRLLAYASSGLTALVLVTALTLTLTLGGLRDGAPRPVPPETGVSVRPPTSDSPAPRLTCSVTRLVLPPESGAPSTVTGGSPNGRYLVGTSNRPDPAFWIWDSTTVANRVALKGRGAGLADVNDSGVAVGVEEGVDGVVVPVVVEGGKVVRLSTGAGIAVAINNAGVILGADSDGPVLWRSATGGKARLTTPDAGAGVFDIDDAGTVYGSVGGRPYVWDSASGSGGFVSLPPAVERALDGYRMRAGWLVNRAPGGTSGDHALRMNVATREVTEVKELAGRPTAVAANGWLAGYDRADRPVLVTPSGPAVLPGLGVTSTAVAIPKTISDDGRTIGGEAPAGDSTANTAVVWRCV